MAYTPPGGWVDVFDGCPGCADEHGNNLERFTTPPSILAR